jgi:hypothetical protein
MEEFLDNGSEIEGTLAIEIMDGRETLNTKNQYRLKIQNFQEWVLIKHPNCLNEEGTLNLPLLDVTILREFLGHLCKKRIYFEPIVYHAFQHVSGYKSAIKNYYSNMGVNISEDILKMFKQFFEGYVRKVAKLKQDGVMSVVEGKHKFLAMKAIQQTKDLNLVIFSHLFLTHFISPTDQKGT